MKNSDMVAQLDIINKKVTEALNVMADAYRAVKVAQNEIELLRTELVAIDKSRGN